MSKGASSERGPQRWSTALLRDVATCFAGLPAAKALSPTAPGGVRVLNLQDIDATGFINPQLKEIAPPNGAARHMVEHGDILLIARGAQPRTALATESLAGALAGPGLLVIRCGPAILAHVLLAYLQSEEGQRALRHRVRGSTSTRLLTMKDIYELSVPVPPIEVQHQIAKLDIAADAAYRTALVAAEKRRELARTVISQLLHDDALLGGAPP